MSAPITRQQTARRERTLLTALLLSAWGPFTTGAAVLMSRSTTQFADFLRRTVDLVALFVAWFAYRRIHSGSEIPTEAKLRLERIANRFVAFALTLSGVVLCVLLIWRGTGFQPGGRVGLGIFVAAAGACVNGWFWRRYALYHLEQRDAILHSQMRLYRTKTVVDLCVLVALVAVAIDPAHWMTRLLDFLGSAIVAGYLLWSGLSPQRKKQTHKQLS